MEPNLKPKRLFSVLLCCAMLLGLAAGGGPCGKNHGAEFERKRVCDRSGKRRRGLELECGHIDPYADERNLYYEW